MTYSGLKRDKEQKLTVTATNCNGEMASKDFTKYNDLHAPFVMSEYNNC